MGMGGDLYMTKQYPPIKSKGQYQKGTAIYHSAYMAGLPVLMAGVLTPRRMALATAATVTLALLGAAWLTVLKGADGTLQMTQS